MSKITKILVRPHCFAAILLTVTSMVFVTPVFAVDPRIPGDGRPASVIALEERVAAGDLEYRDARTGEIVVATAERVTALRESLAPQFAPVSGVHRHFKADGTIQVSAEQPFSDVFVSRINLDGTRTRGCFRDLDAAIAFVVGLDAEQKQQKQLNRDPARTAVVD